MGDGDDVVGLHALGAAAAFAASPGALEDGGAEPALRPPAASLLAVAAGSGVAAAAVAPVRRDQKATLTKAGTDRH